MADDRKEGIAAALEETGAGEAPSVEAEQLDMLPAGSVEAKAAHPDSDVARRGPGRPPGARNKRTQQWIDYIGRNYKMPLQVLADLWSSDPAKLAETLHCKKSEAQDIIRKAAADGLPYLHQKLPVEVEFDPGGGLVMVINRGEGSAGPGDGAKVIGGEFVTENGEGEKDGKTDT